eukprot:gb/GEZJ01003805.1/.p1 GENE.gb/GEZJ01003805.1/~~gb/GEZJ01003805.1/.p1  ORF type:complete len:1550 (+),score=249.77 gb/GEZJ01003805.1/:66-4652(+)
MGDDAARRFKRAAAARYAPLVQISSTQHCDAAVRTASKHRNVLSLLNQFLPGGSRPSLRLFTPAQLRETSARSFARALLDGARDVHDGALFAVADALKERMEALTVSCRHERLAVPLLSVVAVWVCEPQIAEAVSTASMPEAPIVLLVTRPTAQDNAALERVRLSLSAHPAPLFVLRLNEQNQTQPSEPDAPEHSAAAVAVLLDSRARAVLNAQLNEAVAAADLARKALRSSFRSWFTTSSASVTSMPAADAESSANTTVAPSSSGGDVMQLASNSVAGALRRLADLALMAGRYTDATDAYRMLAHEVRTFSSSAAVHHASALELGGLSLALIDGSNAAIGAAFESAVLRYVDANRPELAARAALRAVDFCLAAGFPDSAAGVLVRAIAALRPCVSDATPPLVDAVLAVLCSSCTHAFERLKRPRRASRFAFFAALRFARLRYFAAAAAAAAAIDRDALHRAAVRHHLQYWMGEAALSSGNPVSAVRHFSSVLVEAKASTQPGAVEVHASVVRAFLRAVKIGAAEKLSARWDSGVTFPLLDTAFSYVRTHDMADCDGAWRGVEDEVLEDAEFFGKLARGDGRAKRERRIEALVSELRHEKRNGQNDPGGSLEMKIRRMRDMSNARKRRRRTASLLERGAVLGEAVHLHARLRNPLQFPVFVSSISAVVFLDGRCHSLFDRAGKEDGGDPPPVQLSEAPAVTIAPNSEETVVLKVVGRQAGVLQFIGVCWKFTVGTSATFVPDFSTVLAPGFALLHRHGRRLNDTRHQRASDVPLYEEDKSLTVTIAPLAPKLKTTLLVSHFPLASEQSLDPTLSMRAGEVRKGHLELENEGSVALDSIVFRIGTPQTIYLGIEPEVEEKGGERRVFSIGMKEQPAERNDVVVAGRVTLRLAPGHKARMPVWIRAAVSNAVFAHRSSLSENIKLQRTSNRGEDRADNRPPLRDVKLAMAYGSGRLRISRVSLRFKVHPSVMVSPRFLREAGLSSIAPDALSKIGCLFGVEVEHAGPSEMESVDFDITKLTVTSKHGWKPMLLPAPSVPMAIKRGDLRPLLNTLRINETATFFVFLVRDRDVKDGCELNDVRDGQLRSSHEWETYVADLSDSSMIKTENIGLDSPRNVSSEESSDENQNEDRWDRRAVTHFVVCSKHHSYMQRHGKVHDRPDRVYVTVGWRTNEENEGDIQIPSIDPLRWMKETKTHSEHEHDNGGTSVPQDVVIPGNPNVMQDVVEGIGALRMNDYEKDPVHVHVSHPEKVEHDFFQRTPDDELGLVGDQSSVVACPAVVPVDVLVKNVSNGVLDVAFAAPTEGGVADGDRGRYWTGDVSMSLRSIAPGAERTICLTAVLIGPGQYNMCRFTMLYQTSSFTPNRRRQHIAVQPSYMIVDAVGDYKFCEDDVLEERMEIAPSLRSSRRMSTGSTATPANQRSGRRSSVPKGYRTTADAKHPDNKEEANASSRATQVSDINSRAAAGDTDASGALWRTEGGAKRESRGEEVSPARSGGRRTSRKGRGKNSSKLLSQLENDAFWNDADTDEE